MWCGWQTPPVGILVWCTFFGRGAGWLLSVWLVRAAVFFKQNRGRYPLNAHPSKPTCPHFAEEAMRARAAEQLSAATAAMVTQVCAHSAAAVVVPGLSFLGCLPSMCVPVKLQYEAACVMPVMCALLLNSADISIPTPLQGNIEAEAEKARQKAEKEAAEAAERERQQVRQPLSWRPLTGDLVGATNGCNACRCRLGCTMS